MPVETMVDKALRILDLLESGGGQMPLTAIAARTDLPKPTVHRLLTTLAAHGYVQRLEAGIYALGPRVIALGQFAAANNDVLTIGRPIVRQLVATCGETVHLGILQGESLLYIDRGEPQDEAVRLAALPSPLTSLHASASGKVLLAFADRSLQDHVLAAGLPSYTRHTVTDPDQLRVELEKIRQDGYAINEQERFEGVRAVSVPVRSRGGRIVAALSAAGPVQRVDEEKVIRLRDALLAAADEFGRSLV